MGHLQLLSVYLFLLLQTFVIIKKSQVIDQMLIKWNNESKSMYEVIEYSFCAYIMFETKLYTHTFTLGIRYAYNQYCKQTL